MDLLKQEIRTVEFHYKSLRDTQGSRHLFVAHFHPTIVIKGRILVKEKLEFMKHFRYFLALSIAVIALSIINVSAYGKFDGKPPKSIEQQVHSRILKLPYYEVFDVIKFSVIGATVTLSGKVRNAVN